MSAAQKQPIDIENLARLDLASLRESRAKAAARGDVDMATALHHAIDRRSKIQTDELQTCGKLFRHDEVETIDGLPTGRHIRRYTGDPKAAYEMFFSNSASGRLNHKLIEEHKHGKLETVRVPQGFKVQIVKE